MTAAPEPVWPGQPRPLGATWDGEGTNFAVFAEGADAVDLALFDQTGVERRLPLPEVTAHTWHGYVPEVGPGQRYGFRVHGAYDPERGERRNPAKLLLDPYARAIEGMVDWDDSVFGYKVGGDDLHLGKLLRLQRRERRTADRAEAEPPGTLRDAQGALQILGSERALVGFDFPLGFPEGLPNLPPRDIANARNVSLVQIT